MHTYISLWSSEDSKIVDFEKYMADNAAYQTKSLAAREKKDKSKKKTRRNNENRKER
jgi:hypothetical protein